MNIINRILLTSILLGAISSSIADDLNIESITISRSNNDVAIKAQLIKSDATATSKKSILLYVQDSKCKSSATQFFKLTDSIGSQAARLYVEKIGESDVQQEHGVCSETFLSNSSLDQRISDYQQVLTSLHASADWWNKELYIIGEAEGGLIAGLIASTTPETSKLAIISFGGGMTMSEAWIAALTKKMQADGRSAADIDELQKNATLFFADKIAKSKSTDELAANITYQWWASVVDVRLSETLVKMDIPIYMAHGTEDSKIPVESAQQVADLFSTMEKDNLVYNEYTGSITKVSACHTGIETKSVFTEAINWLVN